MPYADNHGVKINYEVRGTGPAIVFNHGFPRDRTSWYAYADRLEDHYTCVLIDGRGMGLTDKPHEIEAYTFETKVADTTSVMDALGIEKAIYWGYSMGGGIGWASARYAPQRFRAFVIGGSEPSRIEATRQGIRASAARIRANPGGYPDQDVEALYASQMGSILGPGFDDVLPGLKVPCFIYAGEDDPWFPSIDRAHSLIPNVTFFSLPRHSHGATHRDAEAVVAQALPFLEGLLVADKV